MSECLMEGFSAKRLKPINADDYYVEVCAESRNRWPLYELSQASIGIPLVDMGMDSAEVLELLGPWTSVACGLGEITKPMWPVTTIFFTFPCFGYIQDVSWDVVRYTLFALERLLREAGFDEVSIRPHGGCDASLAQMIGLWARRRPMSDRKRNLVSRITLPVVRYLLRHDHVPDPRSSPMVPGLSGTAVRR